MAQCAEVIEYGPDFQAALERMFRTTHNVSEPAGSMALGGLLAERDRQQRRRVAVIHTGGNVDSAQLDEVLSGATPSA